MDGQRWLTPLSEGGFSMACALRIAVAVAACNGDAPGHMHGDGHHEQPPEDCPSDLPEFSADPEDGYEVTGTRDLAMARLVDASDVPPRMNSNDWTILIMDADEMPLEDVAIAQACAHMPDHSHSEPPREVVPGAQPGEFTLELLNFSMFGYWEVEVAVRAPDIAGGDQEFTLCDKESMRYPGDDLLVFRACVAR